MKSIYKIFLLALGVYTSAFSQITEITRLPVQDISQSNRTAHKKVKIIVSTSILFSLVLTIQVFAQLETIKEFPKEYPSQDIRELTPVWISENEILAFYTTGTLDTIFSRRSTDQGQSWSEQKTEQIYTWSSPPYWAEKLFIAAIKGHNNRLILSWKGIIVYSDNNGITWTEANRNTAEYFARYSSFKKLDNNRILFSSILPGRGYVISTDNGETWLQESIVYLPHPGFFPPAGDFSVVKLSEDSLILVTAGRSSVSSPVYCLTSTDGGQSWQDTTFLMEINPITNFHAYTIWYYGPKICLEMDDDKNVYLFFDQTFETGYDGYIQHDVGVWKTSDFGKSWQKVDNFTKYLGYDLLENVAVLDGKFLVTFITYRESENSQNFLDKQNFFGVYGLSEDTFTPPVVLNQEVIGVNYETEDFDYRALVVDDEAVSQVYVNLENGAYQAEMYDDGMHNDSLANDNIYGNTFPTPTQSSVIPYYYRTYAIDINNISLPLDNKGILADVNYTHDQVKAEFNLTDINGNLKKDEQIAEVPVQNPGSLGKFEEGAFLFSGGFFLSGYSNGVMWSNAVASASLVEDYLAGTVGSDPIDDLNRIYIVNKDDKPFGCTWQNWQDAVSLGAEFYDGDGDGIYNPVDKNWNGTWDLNEDMPMLIGEEIAWCVYNDGKPKETRRWNTVYPQGIEVRQTVFATDNPELENVIFIRYSILNTGTVAEVMDSVYFSVWEDGDLGDATNDVIGCDTLLNSAFYYENEPDYFYGDNPPAFFTSLLQRPIVNTNNSSDTARVNFGNLLGTKNISGSENLNITAHTFFWGGDPDLMDPNTVIEARNFILGKNRTAEFPNPCNSYYGQVRGGVDCHKVNPHFWLSGDPVTNVGWICTQNRDSRNLVSTGPFELEKDKPQEIIIAYVIGRGNDPLNSITVARENVQRAIQEYQSNFASMTYTPPAPTNPVNNYVLYQNYPNPFNPTTTIRYELPQDGQVTIEIFDILGQKVKTILNEFKRADRYEVTFSSTGLASGVYIYQLRVNDFITSKKMVLLK